MKKDQEYTRAVQEKSRRLIEARKKRHGMWRNVADIGALGWMFVLPVLIAAILGRALARWTGIPLLALGVIALGIALSGYMVWRYVNRYVIEDNGEAP